MLNAAKIKILEFDEPVADQDFPSKAITSVMQPYTPAPREEPEVSDLGQQNAELQKRVAILREDLSDMAADACRMLRKIERLQAQLAVVTVDRDAWRTQAERLSIPLSLKTWRQRRQDRNEKAD